MSRPVFAWPRCSDKTKYSKKGIPKWLRCISSPSSACALRYVI
jgi:hypothetical protein